MAAVKRGKCRASNDLEPRGHPQSRAFRLRVDGALKLVSVLEIQHFQMMLDWNRMKGNSCGYCDMLTQAVRKVTKDKSLGYLSRDSLLLIEGHPALLSLDLFRVTETGKWRIGVEVFKPQSADGKLRPGLDTLGQACEISQSAADESCLRFLETCLQRCEEKHCCNHGASFLPTRVLKLKQVRRLGPGRDDEFRVRLYVEEEEDTNQGSELGDDDSNGWDSEERNGENQDDGRQTENRSQVHRRREGYAALSHRWPEGNKGDHVWLTTTRENISDFQREIPWTALPETFRDAIKVTHRLGLQYLWIDSLCIIQRDEDDWKKEARSMGDVYSRAVITIAASSSSFGGQPFLKPRPVSHRPVPVKCYGPRKPSIVRRVAAKVGLARADTLLAKPTSRTSSGEQTIAGWARVNLNNLPIPGSLSTRGWTFQERVLSGRIVHFTEEGLIWECMEELTQEDGRQSLSSLISRWTEFLPDIMARQPRTGKSWTPLDIHSLFAFDTLTRGRRPGIQTRSRCGATSRNGGTSFSWNTLAGA